MRLKDFVEYAAFMEEPLTAALELTRGLNLAARGLDEENEARALGRIGRMDRRRDCSGQGHAADAARGGRGELLRPARAPLKEPSPAPNVCSRGIFG